MDEVQVNQILENPKFKEMVSRKSSLSWSLTAVMLFVYVGFMLLVGYNKEFLLSSRRMEECGRERRTIWSFLKSGNDVYGLRCKRAAALLVVVWILVVWLFLFRAPFESIRLWHVWNG